MSDNYEKLLDKLSELYNLDELQLIQQRQYADNISTGRRKLRKTIELASKKKGFSNTKVAKLLKQENLYDLVNMAGAEFCWVMLAAEGNRLTDYRAVLKHFADAWCCLHEITDLNETDPTLLIHLNQWVFIGLNKMLDAAGMPKGNDYQIKRPKSETRYGQEDESETFQHRPSVQKVMKEIGDMIIFQTKMSFYEVLYPYWLKSKVKEVDGKSTKGLRYFIRDMEFHMRERLTYLKIRQTKVTDAEELKELEHQVDLLTYLETLPTMECNEEFSVILGSWIYRTIFDSIDIFREAQDDLKSPMKLELIEDSDDLDEARRNAFGPALLSRPMLSPPCEMTQELRGGRFGLHEKPTLKTYKGDFKLSQKRLDFFNTQALVPFTINKWSFSLQTILKDQDITLGSFQYYVKKHIPTPMERMPKPDNFNSLTEGEYLVWCKSQRRKWDAARKAYNIEKEREPELRKESIPTKEIYHSAEEYLDGQTIWFPVRPEFRGRLLTDTTYLTYQGRDSAKALLKLAVPVPIDGHEDRVKFWLANHIAGLIGGSIDKQSIEKRIAFIENDTVQRDITSVALMLDPDASWQEGFDVLKQVDMDDGKPFMFAAACREWYELFIAQTKTTTDLMVGNDCSCSGQQFMAGWRKSEILALATNVKPSPDGKPHDLYGDIYKALLNRISDVLSDRHELSMRRDGHGRSIVKGGVQPGQYGAGIKTAKKGVLKKISKLADKGFSLHENEIEAIMDNFQDALDEVAEMSSVNNFFRQLAELCNSKGKDRILVPTALGDTINMRYQGQDGHVIDTYKYGSIVYKQGTRKSKLRDPKNITLVNPNGQPDPLKWKTALAANTTHGAGDASMLALALHDCDYHFATNHDAVYCSAVHMDDMRDRMRNAYVEVAKYPLFKELIKANDLGLSDSEINTMLWSVMVNTWNNIEDARDSRYLLS